jgi:hypothetical protein
MDFGLAGNAISNSVPHHPLLQRADLCVEICGLFEYQIAIVIFARFASRRFWKGNKKRNQSISRVV